MPVHSLSLYVSRLNPFKFDLKTKNKRQFIFNKQRFKLVINIHLWLGGV